jgi:hypothetical protein
MNSFLAEQARSLDEKRRELAKVFTENEKVITLTEAHLIVTLQHLRHVSEAYSQAVDYIEDMLYKQLVAAIGKVVSPVDFTNYLAFHYRKIFTDRYRPQAFSYAIRRPDHYPEVSFPLPRFPSRLPPAILLTPTLPFSCLPLFHIFLPLLIYLIFLYREFYQ